MIVNLIRHGSTKGNLKKRYIGTTNEPLDINGINFLKSKKYPNCEVLYCSPMLRCIQTAKIIYPNMDIIIVDNLKECNFGDFENKNYLELSNNSYYQQWIQSNGTLPFPNGENKKDFSNRSYTTFKNIITNCDKNNISMIVHGGTIMSIMEHLKPNSNYFDFQIKNGEYLTIDIDLHKKGF